MFTSVEIIKRNKPNYTEKQQISGDLQISYNDYGHLVLRFMELNDNDNLIVLSQDATNKVRNFINTYLNDRKTINLHVQNLNVEKIEDIPF